MGEGGARALERVWSGRGAGARLARAALTPLELLYAAGVSARGALYDIGVLTEHPGMAPAVSIGNLTVGGTGKTPVAGWLARQLADAGARPAVVLRGYGADEPLVHEHLNPGVPVIVSPDRTAGVARAVEEHGADVVVLDDAFQHRRAARLADVVLVSADGWSPGRPRLLPAGPWREPPRALARATLALVTRKAVSPERAAAIADALAGIAPDVPRGVVHIAADELRRADGGGTDPLATLRGARVLAISAIGNPNAFAAQLAAVGADVRRRDFPDHHAYTPAEADALAAECARTGARAVCTLKDAVKLAPLWPRAAPPLWYVSQRIAVESGRAAIDRMTAAVLAARHPHP